MLYITHDQNAPEWSDLDQAYNSKNRGKLQVGGGRSMKKITLHHVASGPNNIGKATN